MCGVRPGGTGSWGWVQSRWAGAAAAIALLMSSGCWWAQPGAGPGNTFANFDQDLTVGNVATLEQVWSGRGGLSVVVNGKVIGAYWTGSGVDVVAHDFGTGAEAWLSHPDPARGGLRASRPIRRSCPAPASGLAMWPAWPRGPAHSACPASTSPAARSWGPTPVSPRSSSSPSTTMSASVSTTYTPSIGATSASLGLVARAGCRRCHRHDGVDVRLPLVSGDHTGRRPDLRDVRAAASQLPVGRMRGAHVRTDHADAAGRGGRHQRPGR